MSRRSYVPKFSFFFVFYPQIAFLEDWWKFREKSNSDKVRILRKKKNLNSEKNVVIQIKSKNSKIKVKIQSQSQNLEI